MILYKYLIPLIVVTWFASTAWYLFGPASLDKEWNKNINLPWLVSRAPANILISLALSGIVILASMMIHYKLLRFRYAAIAFSVAFVFIFFHAIDKLCLCLIVMLASTASGHFLMGKIYARRMSEWEARLSTSFISGLLLLVVEILVFSSMYQITRLNICVVLIVKLILFRGNIAQIFKIIANYARGAMAIHYDLFSRICIGLICLFLSITFLFSLVPPKDPDCITSHIAYAKLFFSLKHIFLIPSLELHNGFPAPTFWMLYPLGGEIIQTYLYAIGGYHVCQIFQFMNLVLICIIIIHFSRQYFNVQTGLLTALVFCAIPRFNILAATTHVEINMGLLSALGLLYFFALLKTRKWLHAVFLGLILGMMLCVKVIAVYWLAVFSLFLFVELVALSRDRGRGSRMIGLVLAIAAALGCFWYVRNYIICGDPLYPATLFMKTPIYRRPLPPFFYLFDVFFKAIRGNYNTQPEGTTGFAFFILIPFILYYPFLRGRRHLYLGLVSLAFIACSCHALDVRYALPLFLVFMIPFCYGCIKFLSISNKMVSLAVQFILIAAIVSQLLYFRTYYYPGLPVFVLKKDFTEKKLYARWERYIVATAMNQYVTSPSDKIFEVDYCYVSLYFSKGIYISPSQATLKNNFLLLHDCAMKMPNAVSKYVDYLKEGGIKYLVLNGDMMKKYQLFDILKRKDIVLLKHLTKKVKSSVYFLKLLPSPRRENI